jgi:quercetin dioxygenase-like cupin family protein
MNPRRTRLKNILLACFVAAAMGALAPAPATAHETTEKVTPAFRQAIPNLPGKSLVAVVVDYAPGAASRPHVHAKSAFIYAYVLSGAIESRVDDGPVQLLHAGESFHEPPGARHVVSRNASQTEPARLLAVFVLDTGDTLLTTPTPSTQPPEDKP